MSTTLTAPELGTLRNSCGDRFNLSPDAKSFTCKFIEPGLVNYRDQGGGLELLRKDTLDRCMGTAVGNPLIHGHTMIDAANRLTFEEGIVSEWYYNSEDGWYYTKGTADTPRAQRMMSVKKPSCGYQVTSWGPGGMYHGIRYDREITGVKFNHLAIVDKPRYEEATFRFNSMNLFKLVYSLLVRQNGADGKPTEAVEPQTLHIPGDALVSIGDKEVRFNELGEMWMKQTAAATTTAQDNNTLVDCGDGLCVKLNELIEAYKATRKNAAADEGAKKQEKADKEKADKEAFARLNAARTAGTATPTLTSSGSMAEKLERGKKSY